MNDDEHKKLCQLAFEQLSYYLYTDLIINGIPCETPIEELERIKKFQAENSVDVDPALNKYNVFYKGSPIITNDIWIESHEKKGYEIFGKGSSAEKEDK